jgi:hypothetical protein
VGRNANLSYQQISILLSVSVRCLVLIRLFVCLFVCISPQPLVVIVIVSSAFVYENGDIRITRHARGTDTGKALPRSYRSLLIYLL